MKSARMQTQWLPVAIVLCCCSMLAACWPVVNTHTANFADMMNASAKELRDGTFDSAEFKKTVKRRASDINHGQGLEFRYQLLARDAVREFMYAVQDTGDPEAEMLLVDLVQVFSKEFFPPSVLAFVKDKTGTPGPKWWLDEPVTDAPGNGGAQGNSPAEETTPANQPQTNG